MGKPLGVLELCFFHDPVDVGNLISGSSAFSKTSLDIRKFTKPPHKWGEVFSSKLGYWKERREILGSFFPVCCSVSHVRLFVTPWTAARQASLSIINSLSLLKFMSIKLVIPSNHLILYRPLLFLPSIFPTSGSFPNGPSFASGGQSIRASASASVLPMNIQN